jgi:hypothetical protein
LLQRSNDRRGRQRRDLANLALQNHCLSYAKSGPYCLPSLP